MQQIQNKNHKFKLVGVWIQYYTWRATDGKSYKHLIMILF